MNIDKLKSSGYTPKIDLETGVQITLDWFDNHHASAKFRYNAFKEFQNE